MTAQITGPSVIVVVCLLTGICLPAVIGGIGTARPSPPHIEQDTPRNQSAELARTESESGRSEGPSENVRPTPRTPTMTGVSPAVPAGNAGALKNGNVGSLGILSGFVRWFEGLVQALSNPLKSFQKYARKVLQLLVDRPVPTQNGHPAWFSRPDGAIMGAVYEVTWTKSLPVAILLSTLYVGLAAGIRGLVPSSVVPNRTASGAVWKSLGTVFHVILGWTIMVAWAVIVQAVAVLFAPTGATVLPGGQSVVELVVGGGLGGYILWASSGFLALLVIIVWTISWMGTLLAPPAYPLLVAANPPNVPVVRNFRMLPEPGLLFALVAMPAPTAVILGLGYPAINAFRSATTGPIATVAGIGIIPLLTLGMWILALIAPLWMLMTAHSMRPVEMVAAGALGVASAITVQNTVGRYSPSVGSGGGVYRGRRTPNGKTINPVNGSPFQRSTDGGHGKGHVGDSDSGVAALDGGNRDEHVKRTGVTSIISATTIDSELDASGTDRSPSIGVSSRTVGSRNEIPDGQHYEVGFETENGKWQVIEDTSYPHDWLFMGDDALSRIDRAYPHTTLYARGIRDDQTYDVQNLLDSH